MRKTKSRADLGGEEEEAAASITIPRNMGELYNTLPRSWREQNIVTAVKENLDPEELERNQELTKTRTPAQVDSAQQHTCSISSSYTGQTTHAMKELYSRKHSKIMLYNK